MTATTNKATKTFKPLTLSDVEINVSCKPEYMPIDMQSGDPEYAEADAQLEADIRQSLAGGNEYAWCCAVVTATYTDPETGKKYVGTDTLGGVSCLWDDARDMSPEECFEELIGPEGCDMRANALADLNNQLCAERDARALQAARERVLVASRNAVRRGRVTSELGRAVRALAKLESTPSTRAKLTPVADIETYAVIIRCIHERGEVQAEALAELERRGGYLSEEQRRQAGLI